MFIYLVHSRNGSNYRFYFYLPFHRFGANKCGVLGDDGGGGVNGGAYGYHLQLLIAASCYEGPNRNPLLSAPQHVE